LLQGHRKLSIRKLVKGFKWVLCMGVHPRTHLRLFNVLVSPEIRAATQHDRRLVFKWFETYLARGLSSHERARIMEGHYRFVRYCLDGRFMARVCEQPIVLWERRADNRKDYRIVLSFPTSAYGEDLEGDLSLIFQANSSNLFSLTFTIAPGGMFGLAADHVAYVGRSQGRAGYIEDIRVATKQCQDVAPQVLLLAGLQAVAGALNIRDLVATSAEGQVSVGARAHERWLSVYDEFWMSLGATRMKEAMFHLPLPLPEKPLDLIKNNHRSRVVRRRIFKHGVTTAAREAFRTHCLDATIVGRVPLALVLSTAAASGL
jgi:uncharacterized protein VirK/YbjX